MFNVLEGGNAIAGSSQIPKKMLQSTIANAIKSIGLKDSDFDVVGNTSAEFLGDVDIALNVDDLIKNWGLPTPAFSKEFWDAIKQKLGPDGKVNIGLKQFHAPAPIVDAKGNQQPAYENGQPVPDSKGIVQLDFFIGSRDWMRGILSGKPVDSKYKAVFRNVLLASIVSNMRDKTPVPDKNDPSISYVHRYALDFKNGIEDVVDQITPPTGRQKVPQVKKGVKRTVIINNYDDLASWIFGKGVKWENINSFEKLVDHFNSNQYFNKSFAATQKEIIKAKFKEELTDDQLKMLDAQPIQLNEARESIGRFSGKSQFGNADFLEILKTLVDLTGNSGKSQFKIDLAGNENIDMVEKMDASFIHFGISPENVFFMESNYSGPVTIKNVKEKFGFKKDNFDSFMALHDNKKFQAALQEIAKTYGPVRFDSEMFPVFTHEGNKQGDVIFASTRYKKSKFGAFGGFVIFKAQLFDKSTGDWARPKPSINEKIISDFRKLSSGFEKEWKIYSNDEDMRLPGSITVDIGPLAKYLSSENYESTIAKIKDRKKSAEKDAIISMLENLRTQLQDALNNYANKVSSKLGDEKSSVEGVVLRLKQPDGDIFEIKGTSENFAKQAQIIWKERMEIVALDEELDNQILKNVLNLSLLNPETNTRDADITPQKINKFTVAVANKLNAKTKEEAIKNLIPYITEDPQRLLPNIKTNLKVAVVTTETKLNPIIESLKEKQDIIDTDSIRKTQSYIDGLRKKLNDYSILVTSKSSPEQVLIKLIDDKFGSRIETLIAKPAEPSKQSTGEKRTKVIVWNGRAQPWHKGHDQMVQIGKSKLAELGADKVFIMIVKGKASSQDIADNPLNEQEQVALIQAIYAGDDQVEVSDVFPSTSFIGNIVGNVIYRKGYIVSGWLAGEDRIDNYVSFVDKFNPQLFKTDHDYSPIEVNPKTGKKVEFIQTPRVMSGTAARESVLKLEVSEWIKQVAPSKLSGEAKKQYEIVYNILRQKLSSIKGVKEVQDMIISAVNEHVSNTNNKFFLLKRLSEMSMVGGGAFAFGPAAVKRKKKQRKSNGRN
jgi:hypothetical protein